MLREITADQLRPGMKIKAVETYPNSTVTYEGPVIEAGKGRATFTIGDSSAIHQVWMPGRDGGDCSVELYEVVELPTKVGTMIEVQISVGNLQVVMRTRDASWYFVTGPDINHLAPELWILNHMTRVVWEPAS